MQSPKPFGFHSAPLIPAPTETTGLWTEQRNQVSRTNRLREAIHQVLKKTRRRRIVDLRVILGQLGLHIFEHSAKLGIGAACEPIRNVIAEYCEDAMDGKGTVVVCPHVA